jgi:hypothetical protein
MKGLDSLATLGDVGIGIAEYGLAKDRYKFDKSMKEKEYAMAEDAYKRNKARAQSIGNQSRSYGDNVRQV